MKAVGNYRATGGTALYDAVFDSIARLKRAEGRTALIVVTDGKDEDNPGTAPGSVHTLDQVLAAWKALETTIYAIGLGEGADRADAREARRGVEGRSVLSGRRLGARRASTSAFSRTCGAGTS